MATQIRLVPPESLRRRGLRAALLFALLLSAAAGAQNIDLTSTACIDDNEMTAFDIEGVVGQPLDADDVIQISALTSEDDVSWTWSDLPGPGCIEDGVEGPRIFNCSNGLTITLPADPGVLVNKASPVEVSGPPVTADAISFELMVDDGTIDCIRPYNVVLTAPYDVVFVLDRSGSMRSKPASDTTVANSRWLALTAGVNGFMSTIEANACPDSRFGLTLFASRVLTPGDADPIYQLSDADFAALVGIDDNLSVKVADELVFQSQLPRPRGSTAMGSGVADGIAKLDDPAKSRVVMLFTDGEQNRNPRVHLDGVHYDDTNDDVADGEIAPAGDGPFRIVTVGIGTEPGFEYHTTLVNLAEENGGTYLATTTGAGIDGALEAAIQPVLDGCSPQMVTSFTVADPGALPAFAVNRDVVRLLVKLVSSQEFVDPEEEYWLLESLRITRDGADVTRHFRPAGGGVGTHFILLRADFEGPAPGPFSPEGTYSIAGDLDGYRVVVYADDRRLGMDWRVDPAARRVNQPFHPTLALSWLGRPLTPVGDDPDNPNPKVEAFILRPGEDLGDLLARHELTVEVSDEEDAGSAGYQKYLQLLEDEDFLAQLLPDEQQLVLEHQGDGTYSAAYDPGDVSGVYQVLYTVSAEGEAFGEIERRTAQSVYVRFGEVDLEASETSTTVDGRTVLVRVRPRTAVADGGRFVGPANGGAFSVGGAGITLTGVTDHQDGSYTLALTGDPDAQVSVKILDEEIYQGKASDFGPEEEGLPRWLQWLLILVVLLLVIWLIRRLIRGSGGP